MERFINRRIRLAFMHDLDTLLGILRQELSIMRTVHDKLDSRPQILTLEERLRNEGNLPYEDFATYGRLISEEESYAKLVDSAEYLLACREIVDIHDLTEVHSMQIEISDCLSNISDYVLKKHFIKKYDEHSTTITMSVGMGRESVKDTMEKIYEAYLKFAEKTGFETELIDRDSTTIQFRVIGTNAYGYFRTEHGVHRVIHKAPFSDKTQTGFLAVNVMPDLPELDYALKHDDLKVEYLAASTVGGQHANKAETGVKITHVPTGLSAKSSIRSRALNQERALADLQRKVVLYYQSQEDAELADVVNPVDAHTFGNNAIRTYDLLAGRVRDETISKAIKAGVISNDVTGETVISQMSLDDFYKGYIKHFIIAKRELLK